MTDIGKLIDFTGGTFERDRYDRVLFDGLTLARPSTVAGTLEDKSGLITWKGKQVASSILEDRSLLELGDPGAILAKIEESDAAAYGTAVHKAVEDLLRTGHSDAEQPILDDAYSVVHAILSSGLHPVMSEVPLVNRHYGVAGTADLVLVDDDGHTYIGDIKTVGKPDAYRYKGLSWAIQERAYAGGLPVNEDLEEVSWRSLGLEPPSLTRGVVFQVVQRKALHRIIEVDLEAGGRLVELALEVRAARSTASSTIKVLS